MHDPFNVASPEVSNISKFEEIEKTKLKLKEKAKLKLKWKSAYNISNFEERENEIEIERTS